MKIDIFSQKIRIQFRKLEKQPITKNMRNALKTQEEALIYFLELLDIDMIDTLLENNRTYQDMEKHEFIRKLGYVIDDFLQAGDTKLIRRTGICDAVKCHFKCKGQTFTGNHSGMHIDLIIEKNEDGKVLDIYECIYFLPDGEEKTTCYQTRVKIDRN